MDHLNDYLGKILELPIYILPFGILLLSLMGSPHCMAMCGVLSVGVSKDSKINFFLYHGGRLFIYLFLGGMAGILGKELLPDIRNPFFIFFTLVLSLLYIFSSLQILGLKFAKVKYFKILNFSLYTYSLSQIKFIEKKLRAFFFGILSALLPCSWLYLIVLAATTTKNYWYGGLILGFFWLGTVPIFLVAPKFFSHLDKIKFPILKQGLKVTIALLFFVLGTNLLLHRASQLVGRESSNSNNDANCVLTK